MSGENYFIDDVSPVCNGNPILINGDFSAGKPPWVDFTNAPAPKPVFAYGGGQARVSFGSDGTNTQLYQHNLALPAAGAFCTVSFNACSTFGNNLDVKLIKHSGPPYPSYGLTWTNVDIQACSAIAVCGDGTVDPPQEECDPAGAAAEGAIGAIHRFPRQGHGCPVPCLRSGESPRQTAARTRSSTAGLSRV